MYYKRVVNPNSGRESNCKCWMVDPAKVMALIREKKIQTSKDLSLMLLGDDEAVQLMGEEMGGEDAGHNFALQVFEHALDWTIGLAVLDFIRACAKMGKKPRPFEVAANRSGQVFVIAGVSKNVYLMS